jgi:putative multiple sugar transport system permease protein
MSAQTQVQADAAAVAAESRKELWKDNLRDYGLLGSLLIIVAFFYFITADHASVAPVNITNLIMQNSYVVIMALGMLLIIVGGNIDLSVGSIVGFVGAIAGMMIVYWKMPYPIVIVACLIAGAIIGAAQGYLVAYAKMPSFIVTLGGMLIFRGLTGNMLLGQFVGPFPKGFQNIASGFLPDITDIGAIGESLPEWANIHWVSFLIGVVGAVVMFVGSLRRWRRAKAEQMDVEPLGLLLGKNLVFAVLIIGIAWNLALYKGLPVILVIMAGLALLYGFITTRSVIGRRIYALGGNLLAARLSGVKTERLVFLTFANMGLLAALAGMVVAARLNSATPSAGTSFELDVIAACFIGGVSASGGVGKVMNVVIGALFMGVMNNGMSLIGLGIFWQQVVKGLVLLAAVYVDVTQKSKG